MDDVDYDAWSAYLCSLLQNAGYSGFLDIADVACGTGNITLRLAKAGHRLIGIDNSTDMLEIAAQKARNAGLRIPFACEDMRNIELHKPVDAVVCACDGVNYLLGQEDVCAFFLAARRALRPGGLLLFDVSSRRKIESLAGQTMGVDNENEALLWQNDYQAHSRVVQMQLTFFVRSGKHFERFRETHLQKAHESGELRAWLADGGFSVLGEYGDFTAQAPKADAGRIQFVARKNAD